MIQIPQFIDAIFGSHHLNEDCDTIDSLMQPIADNIQELLNTNCQEQAATLFIQLTAATAQHFISEEHWTYFDDFYCPDYTLETIYQWFITLIQEKRLEESSIQILINGMEEIRQMEAVLDYGYPSVSTKPLSI